MENARKSPTKVIQIHKKSQSNQLYLPILIGIYADEYVSIRLEDFISMRINIHNKMEGQEEKRNNKND